MTKRDAMRAAVEALEKVLAGCEYKTLYGVTAWHQKTMPSDYALDLSRSALSLLRSAMEEGEEPTCLECGDGFVAHDPGICGTCYATKYASPTADKDAK